MSEITRHRWERDTAMKLYRCVPLPAFVVDDDEVCVGCGAVVTDQENEKFHLDTIALSKGCEPIKFGTYRWATRHRSKAGEKKMCEHVFKRTDFSTRHCTFCGLLQNRKEVVQWMDSGVMEHNLVHACKENGELIYDPGCDKCTYPLEKESDDQAFKKIYPGTYCDSNANQP